jgi:hypothetical protein
LTVFNYKRDSKTTRPTDIYTPQGYDGCQTPYDALDPLIPYLPDGLIWEPAAGEGNIVAKLRLEGFMVVDSDILTGHNFFEFEPQSWDCLVTNPPYSIKYQWLRRCYALRKPFALLLPVEVIGTKTGQMLFEDHGIEIVFPHGRVNFKMPNKGWDSSAQFPTAWFTWGLGIGRELTFNCYGRQLRLV